MQYRCDQGFIDLICSPPLCDDCGVNEISMVYMLYATHADLCLVLGTQQFDLEECTVIPGMPPWHAVSNLDLISATATIKARLWGLLDF